MQKFKLVVLIHGYGVNHNMWNIGNGPLIRLFRSYGFIPKAITMPELYTGNWDFKKYAQYLAGELEKDILCPHCEQELPIDEIILVGHSMGGITCRLYLQEKSIGDPEIKSRVKKLITIASPHHGTSVLFEDGPFYKICREQLWPGSDFIGELNNSEFPENVDFHSIWARRDKVMVPKHTSVSEKAKNYFIRTHVDHLNSVLHAFTLDIIRDIMDGNPRPTGLQKYPGECECNSNNKYWMPVGINSERPTGPLARNSMRADYIFGCRECDETTVSLHRPGWWWGCEVGKNERLHAWRRTGKREWRCRKCRDTVVGNNRPQNWNSSANCNRPNPRWHRYRIQRRQWHCKNKSDDGNCNAKAWRNNMTGSPSRTGCKVGIFPDSNRRHAPVRTATNYLFKFKCSGCGAVRELRESTPMEYYK